MNGSTNDQFIQLFGQPSRLYFFLLATLVCFLGIGLIVVMRKGWRDRIRLNDFSHFDFLPSRYGHYS